MKLSEVFHGVIPLDVDDENYKKTIQHYNVEILKSSSKWCDRCDNKKHEKCIYYATYKLWLCPSCLYHRWLFENLMEGLDLDVSWQKSYYGKNRKP